MKLHDLFVRMCVLDYSRNHRKMRNMYSHNFNHDHLMYIYRICPQVSGHEKYH